MARRHPCEPKRLPLARGAAPLALVVAGLLAAATPALGAEESARYLPRLSIIVEYAVFFTIFYAAFRFMRGTRGEGILKGVVFLILFTFFVLLRLGDSLDLLRLQNVLETVLGTAVIGLIVLFQPELRRGLLRLGQNPFVRLFLSDVKNPTDDVIEAALRLAKNKVGALIAFERETGLGSYIEGGVKIDAVVSAALLETIFFPGSALHDGAVVLQGERIAAAGCLFPLTDNPTISKKLGTRHRAAIGLSEETDAVTLVVSEETGKISIGVHGELFRNLDADSLREQLKKLVLTGEQARLAKEGDAKKAAQPAEPAAVGKR